MKYIFVSAICLLCFNTVMAQLQFGIKAGINIANQTNVLQYISAGGDPGREMGKPVTRLQASFFADAHLEKKLVLRPEINYSAQGYRREEKRDFAGNLLLGAATIKLQYLNIPLQLLYAPSFKKMNAWIGGGPYLGFALDGKMVTSTGTYKMKIGEGHNNDTRFYDAGVSITAGIKIKRFIAEARYQHGLRDMHEGKRDQNRVIALSVGVVF